MPKSYADLLREARAQIREVSPQEVDALPVGAATIVDVREDSEWEQGHLPGAHHVSKSYIEQQIEGVAPDRDGPVILYCAGGVRSLFAAQTLAEMGYTNVASMSSGFQGWKGAGLEFVTPVVLTADQKQRYSRHLLIPEVGAEGQARLLGSKALFIGAGGLGSPAMLYLAAAGVGTIGIVDFDIVDVSNLQRQIVHTTDRVGDRKVEIGEEVDQRAQSRDQGRRPRGDARGGQRRADHRRLRRHHRRDRHVRDALHPQRRGGRGEHPGRPRQRLPLRGPADDVRPVRRAVLSLPLSDPAATGARARLLGGRRPRGGARHPRPAPGQRGAQGPARDREHAVRPAPAVRCPRDRVHRAQAPPRPELPGLLRRGRRRRARPACRSRSTGSTSRRRSC